MRRLVYLLLWSLLCVAVCHARRYPCEDELCQADHFARLGWEVKEGTIYAYVPQLRWESQISLRVMFRYQDQQLRAALAGYALVVGDKQYPLAQGVVKFTLPPCCSLSSATGKEKSEKNSFCLIRTDGEPMKRSCAQTELPSSTPKESYNDSLALSFDIPPTFALVTDDVRDKGTGEAMLEIRGPFSGDLESTEVQIEGHHPIVLAESNAEALVEVDGSLYPYTADYRAITLGRTVVRVRDGFQTAAATICFYRLKAELVRTGGSNFGTLRVNLFGLHVPPEMRLAFRFNATDKVSIETSPDISRYKPRKVRRLVSGESVLYLSELDKTLDEPQYITPLSTSDSKEPYQIDIPVKGRKAGAPPGDEAFYIWNANKGPVVGGSVIVLRNPERLKESVVEEMTRWQSVNQIVITPHLQKRIVAEFLGQEDALREIWTSFEREIPSFSDFVSYVSGLYLYALRDRKTPAPLVPSPLAMPQVQQFLDEQKGSTGSLLSELSLPLQNFLKDLRRVIYDRAEYLVETTPETGMQIGVLGQRLNPDLTTNTKMQFSLDSHTLEFFSPKHGRCTCTFRVLVAGLGSVRCDLSGNAPKCSLDGPAPAPAPVP